MTTETTVEPPSTQYERADDVERSVWEALETVEDPELPVSIVDLGLVYEVTVEGGHASVGMTLTYSGCPARDLIVDDAERAAESAPEVDSASVELVYSPPWSFERITEQGREDLREHGLAVPGDDGPDPDCYS